MCSMQSLLNKECKATSRNLKCKYLNIVSNIPNVSSGSMVRETRSKLLFSSFYVKVYFHIILYNKVQ
jgi:hypothetical protein